MKKKGVERAAESLRCECVCVCARRARSLSAPTCGTEKVRARCSSPLCAHRTRSLLHPAYPLPAPRAPVYTPFSFQTASLADQCRKISFRFPLNPSGTPGGSVFLGLRRVTSVTHGRGRYGQAGRHGLGVRVRPVHRQHSGNQSGNHSLVQVGNVRGSERACKQTKQKN